MFTKNQINQWIDLYSLSDNVKNFESELSGRQFLKKDLVEAKIMVDRWDVVITDWIFHLSKKDLIKSIFSSEQTQNQDLINAFKVIEKYALSLKLDAVAKAITVCNDIINKENDNFYIWGANVHFIDNIGPDTGIGLYVNEDYSLKSNCSDNLTNSIIVFNVK